MQKYEIVPFNNFSDEEILADIRNVCRRLNKETILLSDYLRHGKYGRKAIRNHFGNFHTALSRMGLKIIRTGYYSDDEIIQDVLSVKNRLGIDLLTGREYYKHGSFGSKAIIKHFGSWGKLVDRLGFKKAAVHVKHTQSELFGMMKALWDEKGRRPTMAEYEKYSGHTQKYILARFKSWSDFLSKFLIYANGGGISVVPQVVSKPSIGSRGISKKLRYLVMKRDNWTCVLCGVKRTSTNDVQLHVDHILPYSKGGKTVMSNLRTLCSTCNLGRGNED